MANTNKQFDIVIDKCKDIFLKKMKDYGTAWRILRTPSLTDQIFIKAQRIRTIEENGFSKINEGVESEYIGIINYCAMALIQLEKGVSNEEKIGYNEEIATLYLQNLQNAKN